MPTGRASMQAWQWQFGRPPHGRTACGSRGPSAGTTPIRRDPPRARDARLHSGHTLPAAFKTLEVPVSPEFRCEGGHRRLLGIDPTPRSPRHRVRSSDITSARVAPASHAMERKGRSEPVDSTRGLSKVGKELEETFLTRLFTGSDHSAAQPCPVANAGSSPVKQAIRVVLYHPGQWAGMSLGRNGSVDLPSSSRRTWKRYFRTRPSLPSRPTGLR